MIAGRHPVEEAFLARRDAHRLLVVPQRRQALERLVLHATNLRIPIVEVEGGTLTALAGFDGHQGIALVTDQRRFATLDELLARARSRSEPPLVLVLDSLEDPQNFGTLLRTAETAGVHGVIFPTRHQAPLSAAAVKASAGAVEHLLLVPVDDLAGALADLHIRGLRILGSEADAPMTAREADLRGPLALVVGSEGQGLGPAVRRRCDGLVRIPMRGHIESLNAAVAGSVLLYEASSQRGGGAERPPERRLEDLAPAAAPAPGGGDTGGDVASTDTAERGPADAEAAGAEPVMEAGASDHSGVESAAEPPAAGPLGTEDLGGAWDERNEDEPLLPGAVRPAASDRAVSDDAVSTIEPASAIEPDAAAGAAEPSAPSAASTASGRAKRATATKRAKKTEPVTESATETARDATPEPAATAEPAPATEPPATAEPVSAAEREPEPPAATEPTTGPEAVADGDAVDRAPDAGTSEA